MGTHKAKARHDLLEWQICDDEATWTASRAEPHASIPLAMMNPAQKQPSTWQQWWQKWGVVMVALTLLLVAVGLVRVQAQATIEHEVRSAVELEGRGVEAGARQGQPIVNAHGVEIVHVGDGWARVRVTVQAEDGGLYRQTRVYQQTSQQQGAAWVRVAPTAAQWGPPRQRESLYFLFRYFAQDEEAVMAAASKLDALYPAFYMTLISGRAGVASDLPSQKLIIDVAPTATLPVRIGLTRVEDAPLTLPSPSATLAPVEMSEEALLVQGVALALFNRRAAQSDTLNRLPVGWRFLRSGLRLWLLWDQELPLARWREPLVHWVFGADEGLPGTWMRPVPAFAHDFCAHHRLWLKTEAEIDMPVICYPFTTNEEPVLAFRDSLPPFTLPHFVGQEEQLLRAETSTSVTDPPLSVASVVVFATLFEYIRTQEEFGANGTGTQGAEKVHAFIVAIPAHQSWETLIPALFGVSRRDFEAGWNSFLSERYGIAP